MKALNKLERRIMTARSRLCIGLDPDFEKLPEKFKVAGEPLFDFNKYLIDQTADLSVAYKPNSAFYEALGSSGIRQLEKTIAYLIDEYPEHFLILDAKRGDIGSTSARYAEAAFVTLGVDAVTVNPYLGGDSLEPFLKNADKVAIILCKTSNPGSGDVQDLIVDGEPLWKLVARKAVSEWNKNNNVMLVMGATFPQELIAVREIIGDMPVLVPGIGAQGGDLEQVLAAGNVLVNASRAVISSDNPRLAAASYQKIMDNYLKTVKQGTIGL